MRSGSTMSTTRGEQRGEDDRARGSASLSSPPHTPQAISASTPSEQRQHVVLHAAGLHRAAARRRELARPARRRSSRRRRCSGRPSPRSRRARSSTRCPAEDVQLGRPPRCARPRAAPAAARRSPACAGRAAPGQAQAGEAPAPTPQAADRRDVQLGSAGGSCARSSTGTRPRRAPARTAPASARASASRASCGVPCGFAAPARRGRPARNDAAHVEGGQEGVASSSTSGHRSSSLERRAEDQFLRDEAREAAGCPRATACRRRRTSAVSGMPRRQAAHLAQVVAVDGVDHAPAPRKSSALKTPCVSEVEEAGQHAKPAPIAAIM